MLDGVAVGILPFVSAHAGRKQPIVNAAGAFRIGAADKSAPTGEAAGAELTADEAEKLARFAIGITRIRPDLPIGE